MQNFSMEPTSHLTEGYSNLCKKRLLKDAEEKARCPALAVPLHEASSHLAFVQEKKEVRRYEPTVSLCERDCVVI